MRSRICNLVTAIGLISCGLNLSDAEAAPQITNVVTRGIQIGGTTILAIQGRDLLPEPRLVASIPIEKQELLEGGTAGAVRIAVTLSEDVTPGIYNLRLANSNGISELFLAAADRLPQTPLVDSVNTKPIALHGVLTSSNIATTKFAGKKDEPLLIEVESQRLGGKLRPVLNLYDSQRRQVAMAIGAPWLKGDARIAVRLPSDGEYSVELHDLEYAAPAASFYRLKIGEFQFADAVFPPVVQRGSTAKLTLIGNVPGDETVSVVAKSGLSFPSPWPASARAGAESGLRPSVRVSEIQELLELPSSEVARIAEPKVEPQKLPIVPVAVSGRLLQPGEEDVYRLPVPEGAKLRFEVQAAPYGSPVDTWLEIRNDKGARLAVNDDFTGTTDSRLDYTVPKGVEVIDIAIRDQNEKANPSCLYRLVIQAVDATPTPGFRLTIAADTLNVPQGSSQVIQIIAERTGYEGPIKLDLDNLPASVVASTGVIPAGSNGALIAFQGIGQQREHIVTTLRGRSVGVSPEITATAEFVNHPIGKFQPWLQSDLALALAAGNEVPFEIDWSKPSVATELALGSTFAVPIKLRRPSEAIGAVKLSLLVGEPPPLVNGTRNAAQGIRAERATVDLAVDPTAKAALDARTAAEKAVIAETTKLKAAQEAGAKATMAAQMGVTAATDKVAPVVKSVEEIRTQLADAQKAVDVAVSEKVAAVAELDGASDESTKVAAEAKVKVLGDKVAALEKMATDKSAELSTAEGTLVTLQTALTAAQAALTATTTATKTANDAATAAVAAAETKRMQSDAAFLAAEAKISPETTFNVVIPPTLETGTCDVAFKTELRSADNSRVVAVYYSPVRRLNVVHPLGLTLATPPEYETRLDTKMGATLNVSGTIQRKSGFAGEVNISIAGQPAGVTATAVMLPADKSEFELVIKFPASFKPSDVTAIKIFAVGPYDPKVANVVVRTELPITIHVLASDAVTPPLESK